MVHISSKILGFKNVFTITVINLHSNYLQPGITTNLAFHSNETSKVKHPGACQTTQKLVHFYMLTTLNIKSS